VSTAHGSSAHSNVPASEVASGEYTGYLIKLTVISTLGGLLFGYDTGVISGALPFLKEDLNLSSVQEASVVSSLLFGAMIGALIGGKLSDFLGRKGALRFCAIVILESAGLGTSAALVPTIAVGVVGVGGTILGIYLLGHVNRRPLVMAGFIGVAAGHLILALMFLLPESKVRAYLILAGMLVVVFFVQTFIGTLIWLLLSEIFPMTIRGFAMGAAVFVLWTTNTIISFVFPLLVGALGATLTLGLFTLVNAISFLFVWKFCPETRGRTLEELEDDFRDHDAAHLVHTAPADVYGS
jgi:hypothetical protein